MAGTAMMMYRFLVISFLFVTVLRTASMLHRLTSIVRATESNDSRVTLIDTPTAAAAETAATIQVAGQDLEEQASTGSYSSSQRISPVNCSAISAIDPANIGWLKSNTPALSSSSTEARPGSNRYLVSFSWWDLRLTRPNFKAGRPLVANPVIYKLQDLLSKLEPGSVFVDVGANVGFITNYALTLSPNISHVISIEPISYNVAKLCEALRGMEERKIPVVTKKYDLYHAAAGANYQESISIIRPSDKAGYFDRASLTKEAVNGGKGVVEEKIPLITIDSLLLQENQQQQHQSDHHPIGLVKLDVQGNEYGVLEGMRGILASPSRRPRFVFYEEETDLVIKAGYKPGQCQQLLESYGYSCEPEATGDIICERNNVAVPDNAGGATKTIENSIN